MQAPQAFTVSELLAHMGRQKSMCTGFNRGDSVAVYMNWRKKVLRRDL